MNPRPLPDLRLAGLAAGTWLSAVACLPRSTGTGLAVAGAAAVATTIVGCLRLTRFRTVVGGRRLIRFRAAVGGRRPARIRAVVGGLWAARFRAVREGGGRSSGPDVRWLVAVLFVGVLCGAASTAFHVAVRQEQPIAGLARRHTTATVVLTLAGDPHPVGAGHIGPPTYAVDAHLESISTATVRVRADAPVFVLASGRGWMGLLPGQRLTVRGRLEPPDPGDVDAALVSVAVPPRLLGRAPWTQRAAGSLRTGLQRACADLPGQVRGLLPGLIDGDTTRLDPAVSAAFRTTGMTHLVAVSGSNVIMILGAALFVARWCRAGPVVTALVCGLALVGFVILVRPSPSVLRAAAMGSIGLIALATGRSGSALPALCAVIAALIVFDPSLAVDVGFGLSVFATAGLLLIAPHWRDALRRRGLPAGLAEAVAVPAAAQVACSPMIAGISGSVSLVAIPANLLAVPAVPVATIVGVAAAVLSPVWRSGAAFCAWLASWPARWLLVVAERGAQAPAAAAAWPSGAAGALLMAVALGGLLVASRYRTARLILLVSAVAAVVGIVPVRLAAGWPPDGALLVVCDVGQGDGMVLPLGAGRGVVVDTGPEPTAIDGCLRRLGIDDVPLLFLTHFHADHVGGIAGALDGRRVDSIVTSPFDQPVEGYDSVLRAAAARRIPVSTPTLGQVYSVGALRLTVLGPVGRLTGTCSDPNNNSQ